MSMTKTIFEFMVRKSSSWSMKTHILVQSIVVAGYLFLLFFNFSIFIFSFIHNDAQFYHYFFSSLRYDLPYDCNFHVIFPFNYQKKNAARNWIVNMSGYVQSIPKMWERAFNISDAYQWCDTCFLHHSNRILCEENSISSTTTTKSNKKVFYN